LKAALAFDVGASGLTPQEAGSALVLIWRYAQESYGLQAVASQIRGGTGALAAALAAAAEHYGAILRSNARVASLIVEDGRAKGVVLEGGETIRAGCVLSSLDRRRTFLDLLPRRAANFGATAGVAEPPRVARAQLLFGLNGLPPFAGLSREDCSGRLIVAERSEAAAEAKAAALRGRLSGELVMEATIPTAADPMLAPAGHHVLSVISSYIPVSVRGGWEEQREILRRRVLAALEKFAPGLKERIVAQRVLTPEDLAHRYENGDGEAPPPLPRLLAPYRARVRTPIAGLYLCGSSAEPVSVLSGRAGRMAARFALEEWWAKGGRFS
jgi:phytoene dehydrogenase-like protein